MNRSHEIIIFFNEWLPKDIIDKIMEKERQMTLLPSIEDWSSIYKKGIQYGPYRPLFFEQYRENLLDDIKLIKGSFIDLNDYKIKINLLKKHAKEDAYYLNSVRY
jgi:hypothetical protein|tara:strand:- start:1200 stop:1514 length:315 start_codon:yes stop_codon:yes gene_type:complete